mmetsp:Transcript_21837/g.29054  ORF Transcript_21837/g.29054 Transcript_21837/m.29054 type:complete len:255 (+) Transcript_21837:41-805(+)
MSRGGYDDGEDDYHQEPRRSLYDDNGNYVGADEEDYYDGQDEDGGGRGGNISDGGRSEGERSWTNYDEEDGVEEEYGDVVSDMPISREAERNKFKDILGSVKGSGGGSGSGFNGSGSISIKSLGDRAEFDTDDHIYTGVADDENEASDSSSAKTAKGGKSCKCCWKQWNHPYIRHNRKKIMAFFGCSLFLFIALAGTYVVLMINVSRLKQEIANAGAGAGADTTSNDDTGNNETNPATFEGDIFVPIDNSTRYI